MNELVCIGKVINFFGIKGELKILSDFDKKELAFKIGMPIMIKEENLEITSIRYHKKYILIRVNNIDDINLITKYIGYNVYVKRSLLNLDADDYLLADLISAQVMEDRECLGVIKEVLEGHTNYARVINKEKEFLVPLIPEYIIRFDQNSKILYTNNAKSLII